MRRMMLLVAGATVLAGCNAEKEEKASAPYLKAHSVQQLMAYSIQPVAESYWGTVQYISDETGTHDIVPETDEDWARARNSAATLTELGNLLMTPLYSEGRGEDWMQFSRSLAEAGQRAEKAAADKDVDAVFEVGGTVYSVCSACHQAYPPANGEAVSMVSKPEESPGAE
ncbi:conserved hypothetical protein [Altererythrobacter sp. B11]|uniref:cytochrome c n=1 Tax=Altererythrobacter sp. B11 TaxID=2060312 RepID=UPI000DC6E79A|nr:cytochrome c [Altererythrobacter sp. B11]BBC73892.1 conserved hypothetical protein [Altererythrobacter sp. B11]